MSKYFTKPFHVSWNEIDATGEVGLSSYFQYVVETAWAWGAANGLGIAESEALGVVWVVHETDLSLIRPLRSGDDFELTIWLKDWRRVRGTRCFELRSRGGGELLAQGVQEIVVLDSQSLRPKPPPEHLIANLRMDTPRAIPQHTMPRARAAASGAFTTDRLVEWRDLDWQEHVNNSVYPAYAHEAAMQALAALGWTPAGLKQAGYAVRNGRAHIQHPSSAVWGEKLDVAATLIDLKPAAGTWYVSMQRQTDHEPIARCVLEWSMIDRVTGDERPMPSSLLTALRQRLVAPDDSES